MCHVAGLAVFALLSGLFSLSQRTTTMISQAGCGRPRSCCWVPHVPAPRSRRSDPQQAPSATAAPHEQALQFMDDHPVFIIIVAALGISVLLSACLLFGIKVSTTVEWCESPALPPVCASV